jgi:hypothetical protein
MAQTRMNFQSVRVCIKLCTPLKSIQCEHCRMAVGAFRCNVERFAKPAFRDWFLRAPHGDSQETCQNRTQPRLITTCWLGNALHFGNCADQG